MIARGILVALLGLLELGYAIKCPKQKTSPGREVVCYTSVSDVEQLTDSICRCTTLVHQGYDVRNLSTSAFQGLQKSLKQINPPLQFVVSIDDPAKTLQTSGTIRQETAARLIRILKEVDGLELNMTAGSKERLFHFVKGLKDEMVRKSYDKRLFMVLPTKPEELAKQFDLKELSKYVDLFTVPTHYLVEDDEAYHTFHPSRLMGLFDMVNADSLIDLISGLGAPKRKILVSVPAGAYRFTLKDRDDNAPRAPTTDRQPVIIDRKQLCESMNQGEWTIERDEDLTAPYAFKNETWIAFDDKISIGIKGKYALLRELPGLAIRNVELDLKTKCEEPLTHGIHHSFTDFKRKSRAAVLNALEDDLHQAQITYPNQVKSSDFRVVRVVDTEGHIRAVRENTQTEFSCTRQGYFVHPKSCNRFYRCVKFNQEVEDYSVFEFDCPAGLAFDERTEVCVWPGSLPEGSPCPGSSEVAPAARMRFECPSEPGYYADPQNGRWFFACIDLGGPELMAYEFRCPYGLVFDEHKLVCEWPWLIEGYSGVGYTRTEYDSRGYGAGSTQGTGGYVTGGLPHGYSGAGAGAHGGYTGTTGSGYSGSSAGSGIHSGGSGFSGAAGVGYSGSSAGSHGTSFGQGYGSGDAGYSGSTAGGHAGSTGYSGSTGGGYSGSTGIHAGAGGSGYTGSSDGGYSGTHGQAGGSGYSGSSAGGYSGSAGTHGAAGGSGYSGSTVIHGGAGGLGYAGSTDGGYSGSAGTHGAAGGSGYSGSNSGGYSGSTVSHGGAGGSGYSSSVYHGEAGGSGYSGSAGTHGAAGGSGYSGSTVIHGGAGGSGYAGSTDGGYSGSAGTHGAAGGSGYSGSNSGGYSGSTVSHGGAGGSGYSSSVYHGGAGGSGYSGSTDGGYSGSAGTHGAAGGSGYSGSTVIHGGAGGSGYAGSTDGGYSGSAGTHGVAGGSGYSGSTVIHAGAGGSGYSGSTDGGYSGSTVSHGGAGGSGYSGSSGGAYSGSTVSHGGAGGSGYSSTVVHGGAGGSGYSGSTDEGYSGSAGTHGAAGGSGYSGSTGIHVGVGGSGYSGSTDEQYSGHVGGAGGSEYSGSTNGGYSGTTGAHAGADGSGYSGSVGIHGGDSGSGYAGSTGHGYAGSTVGSHSSGAGSAGSTVGGYQGSTSSAHAGATGSSYAGTATGGYAGSTGTKYGSTANSHAVSTGSGYAGSSTVGSGYSSGGYDQSGVKGGGYSSTGNVQYSGSGIDHSGFSGSSGSTYSGSGASQSGCSGQSGSKYPAPGAGCSGSSVGVGIVSPQGQVYTSGSAIGTGYVGSTVSGTFEQTPGVTFVGQEHEGPGISYIPSTPEVSGHSGVISTGGQIIGHGISTGSVFPGQSGVTTTYFGNAGTGGYAGTTVYHGAGGVKGGGRLPGGGSDLNITMVGTGIPSIGSPTYHGAVTPSVGYGVGGNVGTGAIVTGHTIQGAIITDDSSSGTVISHGDASGSVLTGAAEQGTIVTGSGYPGYTKTGSGTPGYVINDGVKTVYTDSGSPGTIIHGSAEPGLVLAGTPAPGTIIRGQPSPGIVLTGQTASGVSLGGSIEQGTIVGSTGGQYYPDSSFSTYHGSTGTTKTGSVYTGSQTSTYNTGYKTNEYHDNGGRGTIKFNNGYVTSKYTENDIPDYHPGGVTIPDTIVPGIAGSLPGPTSVPEYSQKPQSFTPSGFTKTGPTKTGITTATLGGRGSYVISTGQTRPAPNPDHIGAKAFEGSVVGYTKSSTESSEQSYSGVTSTKSEDGSYIDTSKITLGPGRNTGYSYPKPSIQFETGIPASSPGPISSTESSVFRGTTPTPFLNVEVYNTPKVVDSAPITAAPAVVNTYSYNKPIDGQYQGNFGKVPTGFSRRPTPTDTPVVYTTSPVDSYKTTMFEASRIPVVISTVRPVVDTGYKTVVSSTAIPVTYDQFGGNIQTGSVSSHSQYDFGAGSSVQHGGYGERKDYVSVTTSAPGISSKYPTKTRPGFSVPTVTYEPPTIPVQSEVHYGSSTVAPNVQYSYESSKTGYGQSVTSSGVSESLKPQTQYLPSGDIYSGAGLTYKKPFSTPGVTYQQSTSVTPATFGSFSHTGSSAELSFSGKAGGSPTNIDISRDEVGKLITNYNRGTTKYIPSEYDVYSGTSGSSSDFSRKQTSSSYSGQTYGSSTVAPFVKPQTPLTVTTYSSGYSRPSSVTSYEVTTRPTTAVGKGKVIVKWSDLHPLLLGKLGAECTCKGDPFANLRGPGSKLVQSSKGQVDLSNYDESEIYVDLEKDGSYDSGDYVTNYESSSPQPIKIWDEDRVSQTPVKPSSTYLPGVSTASPPGSYDRVIGSPETNPGSSASVNLGFSSGHRAGKNLNNGGSTTNAVGGQGASFDRYGPGGLRGIDETLQGTDCARPGLFRHPNFCNKFYACHYDEWKKKFTLHVFNCPVHLTFDNSAGACNWPSKGPACQDDNLLV